MKVDFKAKIKDLDGNPILAITSKLDDKRLPVQEELTLSEVAVNALLAVYNENPSGDEKLTRFKLALKIKETPEAEYTLDEISKVKDLIGRAHSQPLIYARCCELLEAAKS